MPAPAFAPMWILIGCCVFGGHARAAEKSEEIKDFFDQIEQIFEAEDSPRALRPEDIRREQRYSAVTDGGRRNAKQQKLRDPGAAQDDGRRTSPTDDSNALYKAEDADERNPEFEGYQEFVFRPLYACDRFDDVRRYCVFFRQLGTTLTLGVYLGEGVNNKGVRIYWYRYLKRKQLDHFIREPLNKDFLPWNLNLGGSEYELRISPITETDLGDNYFAAELDIPMRYREGYGKKPMIRFNIEPINIDMGSLYHGEEIVIYARAFMELPRTSVTFSWSLFDSGDPDDRGLPSNMRLNPERSSVIIKELKTYQDQVLTCKVFSNKNVLLARRNFLFRGFDKERAESKRNSTRRKRSSGDAEPLHDYDPDFQTSSAGRENNLPDGKDGSTKRSPDEPFSRPGNTFQQVRVPEVSEDLFYDSRGRSGRARDGDGPPHSSRLLRSDGTPVFTFQQDDFRDLLRRFAGRPQPAEHGHRPDDDFPSSTEVSSVSGSHQEETVRFEDKESQAVATCSTRFDCSVRAACAKSTFSGQNYCRCLHGYNGNGLFCFSA